MFSWCRIYWSLLLLVLVAVTRLPVHVFHCEVIYLFWSFVTTEPIPELSKLCIRVTHKLKLAKLPSLSQKTWHINCFKFVDVFIALKGRVFISRLFCFVFIFLGLKEFGILEKHISLKSVLKAYATLQIRLLSYEDSHLNRGSDFRSFMCFVLQKATFINYLTFECHERHHKTKS